MFARTIGIAIVALLTLLPGRASAESADDTKRITLEVGQQVSIPAAGVAKYSEGVPGVVDVRLPEDGAEFIVVGLRPGTTTLLLIFDDGRRVQHLFTVESPDDEVEKRENIRLDFYFVEVTEAGNYSVGLTWPSRIGASSLQARVDLESGALTSATATLTAMPLPRLDLLQRSGWAKVSRQASVITANGKKATFDSGGELNIAVEGSLAAEIRQIPFGTNVVVLPRYDRETGRLELKIAAEVSSLRPGGELPARNRSTVDTVVNIEMNQAVVLAGLFAQDESQDADGLPLISQIPVLGALFGSRSARQDSTQNVIFIVPSVVDVVGMDARRRINDALETYESYSGDFDEQRLLPAVGAGL